MKIRPIYFIALLGLLVVTIGYATYATLQNRAAHRILKAIHNVEPGADIASVRARFGKEMYEIQDESWMERNAAITNSEFRKGKKLYWFNISSPPYRVIEVYTDQEDRVVYVTWQGL
jgi:hypothetical protein